MNSTYQEPSKIRSPMPQFIQAKPILVRHGFKDSLAINGTGVGKISLAEHRRDAALQPIPHGHRQRCS
jgi:hypothetical protein